ncbi:alpha/beta hydrolase [Oleiharenicola lentus]|uniref:alpha/beta hydrolase n=1 Tax=Oleiharenicola lentus TaxID=2508720 RepID=UPI003F66648D
MPLKLVLILTLSLLVAALSLLTWRQAPDSMLVWKLAIVAGEFGHWLVLAPVGLGIWAFCSLEGAGRWTALALCGVAVVGFVRPVVSARKIAEKLPQELSTALGGRVSTNAPFDFGWLYRGSAIPAEQVTTEVFSRPAGQELKLDFYRRSNPRETDTTMRPCLVVIHGGGWDGGDRTQLAAWNRRWVARGYVVAAISYRLAPQFIWPAQREDVRAAIDFLKTNSKRLGIDSQRFVIIGRSAGGQLATAVGYGARDPAIRGVIALYAPHDMPFAWSVSREDDALNSIKLFRQYFGGPPDTPERLKRYEEASGQLLARADSPPTLLVHGNPDTLAWVRHSERLDVRLNELGVKHYFLRLPWATHGFDFNPDGPSGQLTDYAIEYFLQQVTRLVAGQLTLNKCQLGLS